jgi:hypothetical protein
MMSRILMEREIWRVLAGPRTMILRLTPPPGTPSTLRAHAVLDVALTVPYASDAALIISAYAWSGCLEVPLPWKSIPCIRAASSAIELILGFGPYRMRRGHACSDGTDGTGPVAGRL